METTKFKAALSDKSVDATNAMIEFIEKGRDQNTILFIALTVRFGADVHTRVGHLHILCWAWNLLETNPSLRNSLMAMVIMHDSTMLKDQSGFDGVNVGDWLGTQGFPLSNDVPIVPPEQHAMLMVLLDRYAPIPHNLFIKALTDKSVDEFTVDTTHVVSDEPWMIMDMAWALHYYNAPVFRKVVGVVGCPYPTVNFLLLHGRENVEYQRMLVACVDAGIEFDMHQIALLMSYPEKVLATIRERYEKSLWEKACSTQSEGRGLRRWKNLLLAAGLPLDRACKLSEQVSSTEYSKQSCSERGDCGQSSYSDLYQVKYTDENGVGWRFPSTLYVSMLETRVNPANLKVLPNEVLETAAFRLRLLQNLGLSPANPITIEEALEQLHKPEKLFSSCSTSTPSGYQIPIRVRDKAGSLDGRRELEVMFEKQGIRIALVPLTASHCIATVLWVLEWYQHYRGNVRVNI